MPSRPKQNYAAMEELFTVPRRRGEEAPALSTPSNRELFDTGKRDTRKPLRDIVGESPMFQQGSQDVFADLLAGDAPEEKGPGMGVKFGPVEIMEEPPPNIDVKFGDVKFPDQVGPEGWDEMVGEAPKGYPGGVYRQDSGNLVYRPDYGDASEGYASLPKDYTPEYLLQLAKSLNAQEPANQNVGSPQVPPESPGLAGNDPKWWEVWR